MRVLHDEVRGAEPDAYEAGLREYSSSSASESILTLVISRRATLRALPTLIRSGSSWRLSTISVRPLQSHFGIVADSFPSPVIQVNLRDCVRSLFSTFLTYTDTLSPQGLL